MVVELATGVTQLMTLEAESCCRASEELGITTTVVIHHLYSKACSFSMHQPSEGSRRCPQLLEMSHHVAVGKIYQ